MSQTITSDEISERYIFIKDIGSGRHGECQLLQCKETEELIALRKYISVPNYNKYPILNEIQKHKELSQIYPFVPQIIAVSMEQDKSTLVNSKISVLFPYARSLYEIMKEKTLDPSLKEVVGLLKLIFKPLNTMLHGAKAHGNLKPQNVLFKNKNEVWLTDLRASNIDMHKIHTFMSPEFQTEINYTNEPLIANEEQASKADVWALGLIALMMCSNFKQLDTKELKISSLLEVFQSKCDQQVYPQDLFKIIKDMMKLDPKQRIDLKGADLQLQRIEKKYCEGGDTLEEEPDIISENLEKKKLYKKIELIENNAIFKMNEEGCHGEPNFWQSWQHVENYPYWWSYQGKNFHGYLLQSKNPNQSWRCFACSEICEKAKAILEELHGQLAQITN